ncbi:MAG: HlyD family efflux transporter periplasmic adaptor subunit [Microcoleaceae cyanobacterium]
MPSNESSIVELRSLNQEEFLPPISRWSSWGSVLLLATFGAVVALAGFIEYSPTIKASALAQPGGKIQLIQAETEGIIQQIAVLENQSVEAGSAIAFVDPAPLEGQRASISAQQIEVKQELERLNQYLNTINQQILSSLQSKLSGAAWKKLQPLSIDRAIVELTKSVPEVAQPLAQEQRTLLKQQWDLQKRQTQIQRQLDQVNAQMESAVIRAPIDGIITKLEIPSPGETIQPDQVAAHIVPGEAPLIFKALVKAEDISQVNVDAEVHMRISAYPFTDYGVLKGKVSQVSFSRANPDSQPNSSAQAYYEVIIAPDQPYLTKQNQQYMIYSGMEGRADIVVAPEPVLSMILRKARLTTGL